MEEYQQSSLSPMWKDGNSKVSLFTGKNVLALGSHPDDLEIGCLGTLLKYRQNMDSLHCHIFTSGGTGDISNGYADRRTESKLALECIHSNTLCISDNIGMMSDRYHLYVREIEHIVRDYDINMVLITSSHHTHQDHRLLHDVTMTALRRTRATVLCYGETSNTLNFNPRLFVDIEKFLDVKMQALQMHKSQSHKFYMQPSYINASHADSYAFAHGLSCVEKFEIERIFI